MTCPVLCGTKTRNPIVCLQAGAFSASRLQERMAYRSGACHGSPKALHGTSPCTFPCTVQGQLRLCLHTVSSRTRAFDQAFSRYKDGGISSYGSEQLPIVSLVTISANLANAANAKEFPKIYSVRS